MPKFREKVPKHRRNRKPCKHYSSYKKTLGEDFYLRCGYCNDLDKNRIRSYVIDHFVPQKPDGFIHNIPANRYKNLVYACSWCNRAKSNIWPTKNAKLHNDGKVGFILPTTKAYSDLFERDLNGTITLKNNTPLAKYIYDTLNLGLPLHSLNWKFERMLLQEDKLKVLYNTSKDAAIKKEIDDLRNLRLTIMDTILEIYN